MSKRNVAIMVMAVFFVFLTTTNSIACVITDPVNDSIGVGFETYELKVKNFTPGVYTGNMIINIKTDYPESGITVGVWNTTPADFLTESFGGNDYLWAIPLVSRAGFDAGSLYAICGNNIIDEETPVPEPATMFLLASGLFVLIVIKKSKKM